MKTLICMGSFKDVYSPIEMCNIVNEALKGKKTIVAPMCDGGEHTFDVLCYYTNPKIIEVNDIINPYGKVVSSRYLAIDDTAYVVSSEILRLLPEDDQYKNPLELTDYGLGQIVRHALDKGYRKINLCLGGTSTVSFGMGFAQALGVNFFDKNNELIKHPIKTKDIPNISIIDKPQYIDAQITVINDGLTKAPDLKYVNPQKVGVNYYDQKEKILCELESILRNVITMTRINENKPFAGNAGGVAFGLGLLNDAIYVKGSDYFIELFGIEKMMQKADIVITGEGKLDNFHVEKLPISISKLAYRENKRLIYICGKRGYDFNESSINSYGIREIICCEDDYSTYNAEYLDDIETYKKLTPIVIKKRLEKIYE